MVLENICYLINTMYWQICLKFFLLYGKNFINDVYVCMFIRSGNIPNLFDRIMREFSNTIFFVINIDQKLGCD